MADLPLLDQSSAGSPVISPETTLLSAPIASVFVVKFDITVGYMIDLSIGSVGKFQG
jgi:hypothetical protein